MKETTFLLPKGHSYQENDEQNCPTKKGIRQIGFATVMMLLVASVALSGWPRQSSTVGEMGSRESPITINNRFTLSLDQKVELWENWKQFLSWQETWNQTKHKWKTATKHKNLTWDAEKIKSHTRLWANQTEEQGKEWWEHAHHWFQNLSEQLYLFHESEMDLLLDDDQPKRVVNRALEEDKLYIHAKHSGKHHHEHRHGRRSSLMFMNQSDAYASLLSHGAKEPFEYSSDYFLLNQGLDSQINQAYCAVATSVALLNSLRGVIDLPQDPIYDPYPFATQSDAFNECTDASVVIHNETFKGILSSPFGLNLNSAKSLLECHLSQSQWSVEAYHVDCGTQSVDNVRDTMRDALRNPSSRLMINYDRAAVGQIGGGHFSPIGAYSPVMDAFLVMDVAKYKYPAVWIPLALLFRSLGTTDRCGIWDGPAAQAQLPAALLHPNSAEDLAAAMATLNCQAAQRGFIVVSQR